MGATLSPAQEFRVEVMTIPEEQLALAKLLLTELSDFRFAIAGGVAVRLNGYVERQVLS